MIDRELAPIILSLSRQLPVTVITGPRQSGKTTLVKALFNSYDYANMEFPDTRARAVEDPRLFLTSHPHGLIIDEAQRVPELFSYIQGLVDESRKLGCYTLTGSQNFQLIEKISQSLAGRAAVFHLLPFSIGEIASGFAISKSFTSLAFRGTYPRIYDQELQPVDWYPSYISSYIERDVRQIENIKDLHKFQIFLKLCAGRVGQIFNATAMGNEVGVDHKTIQAWMSVLEASFILFFVPPYHHSFNKRLIKSPKIYFYDPGLICSLLGIRSADELETHPLRGEIFESLIISELRKHINNTGNHGALYFWRDLTGHEIDCIIESGSKTIAIEIKSSTSINPSFFKGLRYFQNLSGLPPKYSTLIYGGFESQDWPSARVLGWQKTGSVFLD